jgi:hypothetical protein
MLYYICLLECEEKLTVYTIKPIVPCGTRVKKLSAPTKLIKDQMYLRKKLMSVAVKGCYYSSEEILDDGVMLAVNTGINHTSLTSVISVLLRIANMCKFAYMSFCPLTCYFLHSISISISILLLIL